MQHSSGTAIEDAAVHAYRGNQVAAETRTDEDGEFSLALAPGEYRIEVSALSFATHREVITVRRGMPPLAIQLKLAPILQTVDVADDPYTISLEPDRNLTGLVLDEQAIQDLPDDEEELAQLLRELAGPGADAVGGAEMITDGFAGGRLPPRDQIREIRINNNPFSAENSRPGRGRIEITTRAGTDAFRGNIGFQLRDDALNARDTFADRKPPYQRRNWRSNLSGPLLRERMSFSIFAMRSDAEDSDAIRAITLAGPVSTAVVRPNTRQEYSGRTQYQLPRNHFLNLALEYGSNRRENEGVGGFTLPERATESESRDFNFQARETAPLIERIVHETRFSFLREHSSTTPVNPDVAINVLDAFQAGGAARQNEQTNRDYQFGNLLTYSKGTFTLKTGFQGNYRQFHTLSTDNFLGTFEFSSLEAFAAGQPITFTRNIGNPALNMNQFEGATFLQNDFRVSRGLMLSFGLRYEAQTNIGDTNNFDPRFGFAYGIGRSAVVRGGVGLFHQRLNAGTVQSLLRLDGTRQIQIVLQNPPFPNPLEGGTTEQTRPPASVRQSAEELALPYTVNTSLSFETRLPKGLSLSLSYDFVRGIHLYRSRNANAPLPGQTERPDLARGNILLLESSATSRYHDLSLRMNQRISRSAIFVNYTFSSNSNDTDGPVSLPANSYDLSGEWGRAAEHQRHSVFGGFNFQLPWNLNASTRMSATSGRPYNITTGTDDNHDTFTNDRPFGVARNTGKGPGFFNLDLNLRKTIPLKSSSRSNQAGSTRPGPLPLQQGPGGPGGRGGPGGPPGGADGPGGGFGGSRPSGPQISITANIHNLLNHANFSRFSGVLTSPFFGKPNSARNPREVEVGIQFSF